MVDAVTLIQLGLRWLHFVGGFVWLGALFFLAVVLSPSISHLAINQRIAILQKLAPRLSHVLIASSVANVIAGVSMSLLLSNLRTDIFLGSKWGLAILSGGLVALMVLVITAAIILPALERYSPDPETGASLDLSENESQYLEARLKQWSGLGTGLGVAVLFLMALAVSPI